MPASDRPFVDTARPPLRLLVLQPTPFCNIDCSYCYLFERKSTAVMSLGTLDLVCGRISEYSRLGPVLDVTWHGGEPLTVPLAWYEDAFALMAERCPAAVQINHHFQTNGLLLDERWVRFLARTNTGIGLSIDGPADIHDANRRSRSGRGTHAQAMRAVRLLQDHGLAFKVITVLTEKALDDPDRLFDFYVQNGITEVGFNIEEIEGACSRSSLSNERAEARFRKFIRRFFDRAWYAAGLLKVRELESTLGLLLSDMPAEDEQNLAFAVLCIGCDGSISTFSPELLGAHHRRFEDFTFGHVATHRFCDIERSPLFNDIATEIQRGVATCRDTCQYFRWCGGGAPANKLFETGRFDATETMHCRLSRQAVIDEAVAAIEARLGDREMPHAGFQAVLH
jgi:uncharacterized protein